MSEGDTKPPKGPVVVSSLCSDLRKRRVRTPSQLLTVRQAEAHEVDTFQYAPFHPVYELPDREC